MARSNPRKLWAAHLAGNGKSTGNSATTQHPSIRLGEAFSGTVLGVDPSLRGTGLSLIRVKSGAAPEYLLSQTVKVKPKESMQTCLYEIATAIHAITDQFKVDHAAVEQTIYVQNFQTAQILGTARGAALTALALRHIQIFEYAPLRIKQAVSGHGRASKEQVIKSVQQILRLTVPLPSDEADATGAALCHAFTHRD
ncbi:MAG: crossover junction endodeoxyribonuclease RuvC [Opitutales bacterium]|nr:crossover junction endodeoxyribonuclease RuvC [Opitutales bacterium]NRA26104.1 crossover junction endodeoxyribonuclease RuvC [Opitutales bacterium]